MSAPASPGLLSPKTLRTSARLQIPQEIGLLICRFHIAFKTRALSIVCWRESGRTKRTQRRAHRRAIVGTDSPPASAQQPSIHDLRCAPVCACFHHGGSRGRQMRVWRGSGMPKRAVFPSLDIRPGLSKLGAHVVTAYAREVLRDGMRMMYTISSGEARCNRCSLNRRPFGSVHALPFAHRALLSKP